MDRKTCADYVVKQISELVRIPSPAGYCGAAVEYLEQELKRLGVKFRRTRRGALLATLNGRESAGERTLTGHVDTLAAMVKQVTKTGELRMTQVGSYVLNTVEGEYCTVLTGAGSRFRGTVLFEKPSAHVTRETGETVRTLDNMIIRLDAEVKNEQEVAGLGVTPGDYVFFDPRLEMTETGFVKTRHLDDKAGVACLLGAIRELRTGRVKPRRTTHFFFSTSEEVGLGGAAGIPPDTAELLAVDMGAVGPGQQSDEFSVSICAKDSTGPFDYALRQRLVELCREKEIPHKVDIYPFYGSDAAVAVRSGLDAVTGLIGPGVAASHNLERTHRKALDATVGLILAYLESA